MLSKNYILVVISRLLKRLPLPQISTYLFIGIYILNTGIYNPSACGFDSIKIHLERVHFEKSSGMYPSEQGSFRLECYYKKVKI